MIDKLNHEYITLVVEPEDVINGMLEKVGDMWMVTNGYNETYGFKESDVVDVDVSCKIIYLHG